jgi:hypothetical protein
VSDEKEVDEDRSRWGQLTGKFATHPLSKKFPAAPTRVALLPTFPERVLRKISQFHVLPSDH